MIDHTRYEPQDTEKDKPSASEHTAIGQIAEYTILSRDDTNYLHIALSELDKLVNEYIAEGWQPYGNLVITVTDNINATQAMVKYKDNK